MKTYACYTVVSALALTNPITWLLAKYALIGLAWLLGAALCLLMLAVLAVVFLVWGALMYGITYAMVGWLYAELTRTARPAAQPRYLRILEPSKQEGAVQVRGLLVANEARDNGGVGVVATKVRPQAVPAAPALALEDATSEELVALCKMRGIRANARWKRETMLSRLA